MEIQDYPNYRIYEDGRIMNIRTGKLIAHCTNKQTGYKTIRLWKDNQEKQFTLHRLLAIHFIPKTHEDQNIVDHINRNRTDNRLENLRWVTTFESNLNTSSQDRDNHNCYWRKDAQCYRVMIQRNHQVIYVGSAKTIEEARKIRDDFYLGFTG